MKPAPISIVCVDDERRVLEGLRLTLRRGFHVAAALVSRGYGISHSFIDRMRNFGRGPLEERVRVRLTGS